MRKCVNEACRAPLVRRKGEPEDRFKARLVCGIACRFATGDYVDPRKIAFTPDPGAAKRSGRLQPHSKKKRLEEILARIAKKRIE